MYISYAKLLKYTLYVKFAWQNDSKIAFSLIENEDDFNFCDKIPSIMNCDKIWWMGMFHHKVYK